MAHIDDGKNKRNSTVDLNLVPIIDLMSVCIIFLLITAVWTQVSMIQIGSSIYAQNQDPNNKPEPPKKSEIPFRLDVLKEGYRVIIGSQEKRFPKTGGNYDQDRLVKELKAIKELYPEKGDCVVTILDELPYEHLIGGMDALLQAGFPEISVATGGSPP